MKTASTKRPNPIATNRQREGGTAKKLLKRIVNWLRGNPPASVESGSFICYVPREGFFDFEAVGDKVHIIGKGEFKWVIKTFSDFLTWHKTIVKQ